MKHIDDLLERSTTTQPRRKLRTTFTERIIQHIAENPRPSGRWATLKENIQMKLTHKPFTATAVLVGAIVLSGSTYAFVNWFGTNVQSTSENDIVTISAKDCPASIVQAGQESKAKVFDNATTYKIIKPDQINAEDIKNHQLVTCEHRAVDALARQSFPDSYNINNYKPDNEYNGLYLPYSHYGTVSAVNGNQITVGDIRIDHTQGEPEQISATVIVDENAKVLDRGKQTSLSVLKPGDQVYFSFQNNVTPGGGYDKMWIPVKETTVVRVIAKTQYDYRADIKVMNAVRQGGLEVITTNEPGAG